MKSRTAYAIVSKKRPVIEIMELYTKTQIEDIKKRSLCSNEMVEPVVIISKRDFDKLSEKK